MYTYRIYYVGRPSLSDPYALTSLVFSAKYVEAYSDSVSVSVTFATPQTPADLGPLVKVEIIPSAE